MTIVATLGIAVILGIDLYFVYRIITNGNFYNRSFNKSLAALPLITSEIMLAMQSNLVISLGMAGALSIVRFRTTIKDALDLTFLFWSSSIGITTGTGLFYLSILVCLFLTILLVGLDILPEL